MTSWVKLKVGRRRIEAKIGGYTGLTESANPLLDIMNANRVWLTKEQSKGLRLGSNVRVLVGGQVRKGKVERWSRGSKQLILNRPLKLSRRTAESIRVKR